MFIITNYSDFKLPKNFGIIDTFNWNKYFSSCFSRAYAYANIGPLNINKASYRDFLLVYRIGKTWADKIMVKREFKNIEDMKKKTNILERVLKRFKFD